MVVVLLASFLFIFGLICFFYAIPPSKKLLLLCQQFCPTHNPATSSDPKGPIFEAFCHIRQVRGLVHTWTELKKSLHNMGILAGEKDVAYMVGKVDSNRDGLIYFDEFCELFDSISSQSQEDEGDDGNIDGLITVEELGLVLGLMGFSEGKKMEDCEDMIKKVDVDGDVMVNFEELKRMMRNGKH